MKHCKMTRVNLISAGIAMLVAGLVVGCALLQSPIEAVRQGATKLAESEIAKFNAIEATYKTGEVVFEENPVMGLGDGGYAKLYRNFTGFEIKNITETKAPSHPYAVEIEYKYELLTTPPRYVGKPDEEAKALAQKDTDFKPEEPRKDRSVTRRYFCDAQGNHVGKMRDLPPVDTLFLRGHHPVEESVLPDAPAK